MNTAVDHTVTQKFVTTIEIEIVESGLGYEWVASNGIESSRFYDNEADALEDLGEHFPDVEKVSE